LKTFENIKHAWNQQVLVKISTISIGCFKKRHKINRLPSSPSNKHEPTWWLNQIWQAWTGQRCFKKSHQPIIPYPYHPRVDWTDLVWCEHVRTISLHRHLVQWDVRTVWPIVPLQEVSFPCFPTTASKHEKILQDSSHRHPQLQISVAQVHP
jgi:hypothetical protein